MLKPNGTSENLNRDQKLHLMNSSHQMKKEANDEKRTTSQTFKQKRKINEFKSSHEEKSN